MDAIIIMINNFFHDLTSALWFITALVMWYLDREAMAAGEGGPLFFYNRLFPRLLKVSAVSILLNLAFGGVRAWAYLDYEYMPAAGRGQLNALIIKHIVLFGVVLSGLLMQLKLYKRYRHYRRCH